MRRSLGWVVVVLGTAALAAGCGESHHSNGTRPAEPITITALIDSDHVEVSPTSFGAGPITLLISNQSGRAQHVTFQTDETGGGPAGIRSATDVPLEGTAQIQVSPRSGTYQLLTGDGHVKPASVHVGGPRPSAQDQLLQP